MDKRTVTLKAEESKTIMPDQIVISLTVKTSDKKYENTVKESNEKINILKQNLISVGYRVDNIKTKFFNVNQKFNILRDNKGLFNKNVEGYECYYEFEIEIDYDLELLNKGIEVISKSFTNPNVNISFALKNIDTYYMDLLHNLAVNAKKKAEILCVASGGKLGNLVKIDYDSNGKNIFSNSKSMFGDTCQLQLPQAAVSQDVSPIAFHPDEIKISQSAIFEWEII